MTLNEISIDSNIPVTIIMISIGLVVVEVEGEEEEEKEKEEEEEEEEEIGGDVSGSTSDTETVEGSIDMPIRNNDITHSIIVSSSHRKHYHIDVNN